MKDSFVFQRSAAEDASAGERRAGPGGRSDDPVGQEVAQRRGDGQSLHLLRGLHSAEGHPAQVLQASDATGTLPEVHATVTAPASKQTGHQRERLNNQEAKGPALGRGAPSYPAARTLPVVEKAQQRPLGREATA